MNNYQRFNIQIGELCLEQYADPPEDSLGELSDFEIGLRRFCYESDRPVLIEIGDEKIQVFFDPDICMILEDNLPEQIYKLSLGQEIEIFFAESSQTIIKLIPVAHKINCNLIKFGNSCEYKQFELERNQLLEVFKNFLDKIMQLTVDGGYITPEEKQEFLMPIAKMIINPFNLSTHK